MVSRLSDAHWHAELSCQPEWAGAAYWLHPFLTYRTFCPYLVGDYDEVGAYLAGYLTRGVESVVLDVLDVPAEEDDLHHARIAFARAFVPDRGR